MNDISFSVATTSEQGWSNSNTTYTMQNAPNTPYSEYLSLPFKLEPGTTVTNNTINTSNQQYQTVTTQQYQTTPTSSTSNHYNIHYNNTVHNFIPAVAATNAPNTRIAGNHVIANPMMLQQQDVQQQVPTIKQEPNMSSLPCTDIVMFDKDKRNSKYKCDVCDKNFAKKPTLKLHMRTHTGERPYHCQVCGKSFTQKQSVKIHMRIHTGEKPFKCATCDYTARTKGNLDNHMRKHTGERPFICKLCQKSYTQKSSLNTHIKTVHSDNGQILGPIKKDNKERPYQCTICNKRYTQKSSLNTHMKSSHNVDQGFNSGDKILPQINQSMEQQQQQWHVQSVNNNVIGQQQEIGLLNQQYRQMTYVQPHVMKTERLEPEAESGSSTGSPAVGEEQLETDNKQLEQGDVVNVAPPVTQMLTPQSSCSSGYPSPPVNQNDRNDEERAILHPFQMTPIHLHSL